MSKKEISGTAEVFNHLEIETIGSCNRVCNTCLRQTYIDKNNPVHSGRFPITSEIGEGMKMPTSTFKGIVDQAVDMGFTGAVCLQHYNEPLLDERLVELAEYVKSKPEIKGPLSACSNMDLITEARAKELDGLFDHFMVALYMSEEKQKKREGYLLELFNKTCLKFTMGRHIVTHYSPFTNTAELVAEGRDKACTYFNRMLIIAYDGTVLHCCDDYAGHFGLGNVNTMTLREIWESEKHKQLQQDLSIPGGRMKYSYCAVCPRIAGCDY